MIDSFRLEPIDEEIRPLIDALNAIPGVATQASCCGHGKDSFYVWLQCSTIDAILNVKFIFQGNIDECDGSMTHYDMEVAPLHTIGSNQRMMDREGNLMLDDQGNSIQCVNFIITSTDMQGVCTNVGMANKEFRQKEYAKLAWIARSMKRLNDLVS